MPTGSSITEAKIVYSSDGISGPWKAINETYETWNDGIVANNGTYNWQVPDDISTQVLINISDPLDPTVYDESDDVFKIRGNFSISSPAGGERWCTMENHTISWNTTGSIDKVRILYSRDNFTSSNLTVIDNLTNVDNYIWQIPDPVFVFSINATDLPISVSVRLEDYDDPTVNVTTPIFSIDYYNITWYLRDWLSNLMITGDLEVSDTSGWAESGLGSPVYHKTPYGSWEASWSHEDYGGYTEKYVADADKNITVWLESEVVHVWEALTEFVYYPEVDTLTFQSYLVRDGAIAGARDENGTFYTIAENCTIEIYYPNGTYMTNFTATNLTDAGKLRKLNNIFLNESANSPISSLALISTSLIKSPLLISFATRTNFLISLTIVPEIKPANINPMPKPIPALKILLNVGSLIVRSTIKFVIIMLKIKAKNPRNSFFRIICPLS